MQSVYTPNYQALWDTMVILPEWESSVHNAASIVQSHKDIYQPFAEAFNPAMPWQFVGVIHMMESSCNFHTHLHNGDSLDHKTVHEPKGRPPLPPLAGIGKPYTWQESAKDALRLEGFHLKEMWGITNMLARLEAFNGLGYQRHSINTPYVWSGTNHYRRGKFTEDGHFDINVVSKQVGAAPILKLIL